MNRTEWYLALIVYLLASIMYTLGDQHTPIFITYFTLILVHIFPVYLLFEIFIGDGWASDVFGEGHTSKREGE